MQYSKQPKLRTYILPNQPGINYLLTQSEVFTVKYETDAFLYWPNDSEVNTARPKFDGKETFFKVIYRIFSLFLFTGHFSQFL